MIMIQCIAMQYFRM